MFEQLGLVNGEPIFEEFGNYFHGFPEVFEIIK